MKEWNDPFIPFNSWKGLVHGDHFEAIVNECYLPPVVVNLDVSGTCNYKSGHCHHRAKQIRDRGLPFIDTRLAEKFPAFLKNWTVDGHGPKSCCIVGSQGDALLFDGLPKLLKELYFNSIDVGLVSNGYAYDDKLIDFAVHYCKFVGFSMDAGTKETYDKIHNPPNDGWERVLGNISKITNKISRFGMRNDVGFKFLILPQSYHTLYEACGLAKDLGVRYVQIRPADLPDKARASINIHEVQSQIERAMSDFDEPGVFEIAGVRHKFTPDFKKVLPEYCYMTPLTVTITSDAKVWPCVDRRWDEPTLLADCSTTWQALKDVWGSAKHIEIVHNVINNCGKGPACNIRCSNYGYAALFERVFVNDDMDRTLI